MDENQEFFDFVQDWCDGASNRAVFGPSSGFRAWPREERRMNQKYRLHHRSGLRGRQLPCDSRAGSFAKPCRLAIQKMNRRREVLVAGLVILFLLVGPASIGNAQFRSRYTAVSTLVLPAPPRELRRSLERAERYVEEGRYTSAVELLDAILSAPDSEDYFLRSEDDREEADQLEEEIANEPVPQPPGRFPNVRPRPVLAPEPQTGGTTRNTLKTKACRILGSLPKQGREFYELQVGKTARRELDAAVQARKIDKVDEISRRYFHTEAGYEATLLLARHAMDHGLPTTAAIHLARLRESPQSAQRYEPQLSVLLATCHKLNRDEESAAAVMADAHNRYGNSRILVAGDSSNLPANVTETRALLDRLVGTFDQTTQSNLGAWKMFRGGQNRNAVSRGGMPLQKREWSVDTAVFISDEKKIADEFKRIRETKKAVIPVAQPLAVGDHLIMQAARMVLGIDLNSGRRVWPYPWNTEPEPVATEPQKRVVRAGIHFPANDMQTRIWRDFVHAQMSSDGDLLYILRNIKSPAPRNVRFGNQLNHHKKNKLVARELATEGKTVWVLGGDEGDDPALSEAFFLGAPLPVDDQLFVVAEIKDELRLLSLDNETGTVHWSQQLGHIESQNPAFQIYPSRGLTGSCLAYSDGILICPTTSGAIIAVDTQRRWLLWSYSYPPNSDSRLSNQNQIFQQRSRFNQANQLLEQWADAAPIIADGRVIITPVESDRVYCLNLLNGELEWRAERESSLYVAGAWNGLVIMADPDRLRAFELTSGKMIWKSEPFEDEGLTCGRGFYCEGHYYHPTSAKQLLKVDVADGSFKETMQSEYELGNLICHGDYVISQSHDAVHAFLQRDRMRPFIAKQLRESPNDPAVLENHASLLIGDGKTEDAIRVLRRADTLAESPQSQRSIRSTLAMLLMDQLTADFTKHEELLDEVNELLSTSNDRGLQRQFHRTVATGFRDSDRTLDAFRELLAYAELVIDSAEDVDAERTEKLADDHRVDMTLWVSEQLGELHAEMSTTDQAQANALLREKQAAWQNLKLETAQTWLACISNLPIAAEATLQLADRYSAQQRTMAAELLLAGLSEQLESPLTEEAQWPLEATAKLAQLLLAKGEWETAERVLARLSSLDGSRKISGDLTRATLEQKLQQRELENEFGTQNWPRGEASWEDLLKNNHNRYANSQMPVKQQFSDALWPHEYRVEINRSQLIVYDGYNRIRKQIKSTGTVGNSTFEVVTRGHLLICSNGTEVAAIDLIGDYDETQLRRIWKDAIGDSQGQLNRQSNVNANLLLTIDRRVLGPVSDRGVAYLKRGDLVCSDLLTGEPIWKVAKVGTNATVFGNRQFVFVAAKDSVTAHKYDMRNGRLLGKLELPFKKKQWRSFGTRLLGWKTEKKLMLNLFDAVAEKEVWHRECAASAPVRLINGRHIAICEPSGKLEILETDTGKTVVLHDLEVEGELNHLVVLETPDQFIVGAGKPNARRGTRFGRTASGFQLSGQLYAFDRETGQPAWETPTEVIDYQLLTRQAVNTPILVFARSYTVPKTPNTPRPQPVNELACIDRRNGEVIFRNRLNSVHPFTVTANPTDASLAIEYVYGNKGHTITFNGENSQDGKKPANKLGPVDVETEAPTKESEDPFAQ
jgi:outer membrane protein assembly factor BamB